MQIPAPTLHRFWQMLAHYHGQVWNGAELARHLGARPEQLFYWASHGGAELDLLVVRGGRRRGFDVKRTTAPSSTRSMHAARQSLGLEWIDVIHAGEHTFPLAEGIRAVAFRRMFEDVEAL